MPVRILVVGAGCTGAAASLRLRQQLGSAASIQVWEKARGAGGRYTTSRDTYPDGMRADMGAQYASVDPQDAESVAVMQAIVESAAAELVNSESLSDNAERPCDFLHYRGVGGQNSIVKAMLSSAKAEVVYERRVSKLDLRGKTWRATAYDGASEDFDAVVMCVPGIGPGGDNLNKIHGNWERCLTNDHWKSVETPHDCRYSVALWLASGHQEALAAFFGNSSEKKVKSNNVELLFWQSRKDSEPFDGPQVIVAHTAQGARGNKQQMEPRIISESCNTIGIPNNARTITSKKIITWFQSQVVSTNSSKDCVVACCQPPLVLAGDYCVASTFTGCVKSAFAAVSEIVPLLDGQATQDSGKIADRCQKGDKPQATSANDAKNGYTSQAVSGNGRETQRGNRRDACSYCNKKDQCFKDDSDGKMYCASCWKHYYGKDPRIMGA